MNSKKNDNNRYITYRHITIYKIKKQFRLKRTKLKKKKIPKKSTTFSKIFGTKQIKAVT